MKISYKTLENESHENIHKCFEECFADYLLDMSYMTLEAMKYRQILGRVDLSYSVGAFDNEKMIGLLIIAVDEFDGKLTAFDAGTGVVKKYRGQGVAGGMFKYSLKKLKERNVECFMLEVLQDNSAAIKAYEKEGFKVRRHFDCYDLVNGDFTNGLDNIDGVEVRRMSIKELEENRHMLENEQSWEHGLSGVKIQEESIIIDGAFKNNKCVGFVVYTPQLCWLIGIAAEDSDICKLLATQLIKKINPIRPFISWNNIEPGNRLANTMVSVGFKLFTKQYEMICDLK